ncbi:GNAT family protein [Bacillus carboniphilus]|uniref:GNAT family protein n=1 Tax=Bacillus carboniphilus TaxID=86663 RepID=A0ABY9K168_9BACI|nr:GNAT family protein [Bacillus carboniphilus]WLR44343.1 GNAT family protein [Bacillus carboniphilus]
METKPIFEDLPTIETDRLILRKMSEDDVDDLFHYGSDKEVTKYLTWETYHSKEDALSFIQYALTQYENKQPAPWAIEYKEDNKFIGTIDFRSKQGIGKMGYVIAKEYWGKGIMTEVVSEVIAFAFKNTDAVRIQAECFLHNIGSARVMEKVGMTYEGILRKALYAKGTHHDVKMYSILREEFIKHEK